jgi:hypothetical protein
MRKLRSKIRRTIKEITIVAGLFAALAIFYLASIIPSSFYLGFGVLCIIGFIIWMATSSKTKNETYIDDRGYVVLALENDLEHRFIAKNILDRNLKPNEIVHHINGKRIDNQLRNLCLMDREKHELFHSWLRWKKQKSGRYPSFEDQKRILTQEYSGILLEQLAFEKSTQETDLFDEEHIQIDKVAVDTEPKVDTLTTKNLFEELRKERLRLAHKENLPAYSIFYDKTLHLMARVMPDTDLLMLKMTGPTKYQKYGPAFLAIIKRFKADLATKK